MPFVLRESDAAYANFVGIERALREGRVRLDTGPSNARIDITSRCDLRCLQCMYTATRATSRDMPADILGRIESEILPTLAAVQYADEGEPLLFRDLARVTDALGRHRPAYSRIFTHAMHLDEDVARALIRCQLRDVAASLDGASEATFARIRRGASLERIVRNLERLRDLKRAAGSLYPIVSVHTVVMRDNLRELAEIVRLGARLGAAEVLFYKMIDFTPEMAEQSTDRVPEETLRRLAEALDAGMALGMPVRISPYLPTPPAPARETIDERFYAGRIEVEPPAGRLAPGRRAPFRVRLHNLSPFTWYSSACPSLSSEVAVATHLHDAAGALVEWDGERTPLPRPVAPGARVELEAYARLPEAEGEYELRFDLVNERARWFGLETRLKLRLSRPRWHDLRARRAPALDAIPIEATPTERERCQHPWKYVVLKATGNVYPCRFLTIPMGNLTRQSFGEIWNSQRYLALRESILDDSYDFCRGSPCLFAAAPPGMFRAEFEVLEAQALARAGERAAFRLAVVNTGRAPWNAAPDARVPTAFVVACSFFDERRALKPYPPHVSALPHDVPTGARAELRLEVPAPPSPGRYILGFDISRQHVFSFNVLGSPMCELPLLVTPRAGA